ncbi:MAG: TolB protein [Gaiellaceae bacterium]|nr:TolB protein [Gaiellaceae bacterium]
MRTCTGVCLLLVLGIGAAGGDGAASRALAYTRFTHSGSRLYLLDLRSGKSRALAPAEARAGEPGWSHDGQQLVFSAYSADGRRQGLKILDHLGRVRWITSHRFDPQHTVLDDHPQWSPDGGKIVFHEFRAPATYRINVLRLRQGSTTTIASGFEPSWSPDGRSLAFANRSRPDGTFHIYLMSADGTGIRRLTATLANEGEPSWSPDGKQIAFVRRVDGDDEIMRMNADGSEIRRLTYVPGEDVAPTWSPDGSQIAFASRRRLGQWDLFLMSSDGRNQHRVTQSRLDETQPVWQPSPSK